MPDTIEVVIEIPRGSRNKYEWDDERGVLRLDRTLYSSVHYPTDYGYIPGTHADDGDHLDVLVIVEEPTLPGCYLDARPIGVLRMRDDKGGDDKVICVPVADPRFAEVREFTDISPHWQLEIAQFFRTYKALQDLGVEIIGWGDRAQAWQIIEAAQGGGEVTRRLVIATNNPGKLREFQQLLDGCGFELVTPRELGVNFDPEETGSTFAENATMKAVEAARACGLPALADDSGLEVDHLGGRPGIFSARYAGGDRTDPGISEARQLELLLEEMRGVPDAQRSARFRCVIAIVTPDGGVQLADGVWEGRIAHEARGTHGFGYDPVFVADGRDVTSAQLPREEKNRISHRGQAAAKARELLRKMPDDRATA